MNTCYSIVVLILFTTSPLLAADRKVDIRSPVKDEKCPMVIQVDAKTAPGEGWPVVFVKPQNFNFPYYVQEPVAAVDDDGSFSATAQLGELDTLAGTRFTVIVVLLKDKAEAKKYSAGKTIEELPDNIGSARVPVSRK